MSERVPVTPETLRAAMRDPRYRNSWHPEHAAYRDWIAEGWQAHVSGGEGRNGVVQVRAYTRTRDGRTEQVGAHTRGDPPGGDRADTAAIQVSTTPPANATPPMPRPEITADSPTLVIFVGGAKDGKHMNVRRIHDDRDGWPTPAPWGREYFEHDQSERILRRIAEAPPGTRIVLVGHSWGGDTSVRVAAELGRLGRPLDLLVTVDPVGRRADDALLHSARLGTRDWLNIRAVPSSPNASDVVAWAGRRYGDAPRGHATRHVEANTNHGEFGIMLNWPDRSGLTGFNRILGR